MRPNTMQDYLPMTGAMIGICMPSFLLGPLLVLIFGIHLDWLPVSGWGDIPGDKILPAITLGTGYAAYIARLSRGGMLEVLSQDYIRTARAKGLSERLNYYKARPTRWTNTCCCIFRSRFCRAFSWLICCRNYISDSWFGPVLCTGRF